MITKGIVVAVGGNALIRDKHQISVESQSASIQESSRCIAALVDAGYTPVITHGNGPQVGFLLRRAELALDELPALPLDVLGADTQGATGYLFTRNLRGCLAERGIDRQVVAVVTQSLVDPDDPAFAEPSKPIGSFMDEAEAREMLAESGQDESGLDQLARVGFDTLGLQTFLTAGEKESRAWTIHKGDTAPKAAGVIHTDFEKGFIKAEIVSYEDLVSLGSIAEARAHGRVRMEGKDYVMQDGDVVEFRSGLASGGKK